MIRGLTYASSISSQSLAAMQVRRVLRVGLPLETDVQAERQKLFAVYGAGGREGRR